MEAKSDRLLLGNWILFAAILVSAAGMILIFGKLLPIQVPLFYSRPWGEDQLGKPLELLIPIGLALGCGVGCGIAYKKLFGDKILARMVLVSGIMIQLLLSLGVLRIVLLIT